MYLGYILKNIMKNLKFKSDPYENYHFVNSEPFNNFCSKCCWNTTKWLIKARKNP